MNFVQSIKKIKARIFKNGFKLESALYIFFVFSFLFYAFGDLVTSGQTYHYQADRKLSYVSLGFLVASLVIGIIFLIIKSIKNNSLSKLLKNINPLLFLSIIVIILLEILSGFINKVSFSTIFLVVLYPIIFLMIYIFFIGINFHGLDKKLLFSSFLLFFIFYSLFFIFYFFYIQGKPTSGGGLRIPTLAHVFFLLSIFCYLRRFLTERTKIILYCFTIPIVLLSGKMSVTIILLVYLFSDLINSTFFERNKKIMRIVLISIFAIGALIILVSNITKNNFLADNFSFESLLYSGRIENWSNILPNMKNFTAIEWLFGKGPSATLQYNKGTAAHNDFIEFIFDYGVLGLMGFLCLILSFFIQFLKQKAPYKRELGLSIVYLLILDFISAFFINMNMLFMVLPTHNEKIQVVDCYVKDISFFEVTI